MFMQKMKEIKKTMSTKQMLEYIQGLVWCYVNEMGKKLPEYFGKELQVSDNNSKTGFPTVNMPSLITCLIGIACNMLCYACKGRYVMDTVEVPRISNLWLYLTNAYAYKLQLIAKMVVSKIIRFNDSGDLPDYQYCEMIINTAIDTGCNIQFFTKKHFLVNRYCKEYGENAKTLENKGITIIFSRDPKITNLRNPYNFKEADIIEDETIEDGTILAGVLYVCNHGKCINCYVQKKGCFDPNIEVIYLTVHTASEQDKDEYFNS